SWEVEIELLEAGTVPGGLLGLVPALNTPDPGNGWTLDLEYSGILGQNVAFPSPDFVLTDVDGGLFRLSDHFGSVIIIDLTMRCPPCTDQIKQLIPVDKNHGDGVVIISIDTTGASNDVVRNYKQSTGGTWAFARDTDAVVQKYQMTTMRKLVMIDINGNVFYTSPDVVSTSELEQHIATGLSGQALGIDLGSMGLLGLAFFAGISAFFAPCALPLLPGYLLNISGNKEPSKKAALSRVSFAVSIGLGAAVFYIFLGGVIAGMGALAADVLPAFGVAAALLLIFVGVAFLMGKHLSWSVAAYRLKKALGLSTQNEFGARPAKVLSLIVEEENREVFLYGVGYGAASSACHGVLLVSVMLAASSGGWLAGFQAVMLWSLGMLAMMAAAFFLAFFVMENAIEKLAAKTALLNRFSGLLLAAAGIWMVYYLL
ncbi:MAG: cytochrome c biogenesis protein CcdA, partial [Candidatus Thermoplasmatota archaeon]|nr:cytochrome c biogenesis protein CcdA [Candidatus Thermoplasmatota archaeon]